MGKGYEKYQIIVRGCDKRVRMDDDVRLIPAKGEIRKRMIGIGSRLTGGRRW